MALYIGLIVSNSNNGLLLNALMIYINCKCSLCFVYWLYSCDICKWWEISDKRDIENIKKVIFYGILFGKMFESSAILMPGVMEHRILSDTTWDTSSTN